MKQMIETTKPGFLRRALDEAKGVLLFSGAGMSAELGIPTYWTGKDARYASDVSSWGLTALEHATAPYWKTHPDEQRQYYQTRLANTLEVFDSVAVEENHYLMLLSYLHKRNLPYFNVTSNVDSAFTLFGFDPEKLYEVHGTGLYSQCLVSPKQHGVFPSVLNGRTTCPVCGNAVRPNILHFDDLDFNREREDKQLSRYFDFLDEGVEGYLILELGAGVSVPRIRNMATRLHHEEDLPYVHVNPHRDSGGDYEQLVSLLGVGSNTTAYEAWLTISAKGALSSLR